MCVKTSFFLNFLKIYVDMGDVKRLLWSRRRCVTSFHRKKMKSLCHLRAFQTSRTLDNAVHPPRGKHPDAMCKKTACSSVIPSICLNVGPTQEVVGETCLRLDRVAAFIANSWWKLVRGGPIISRVPHAIWFLLPRRAHSFTRSPAHSLLPTHTSPSGTERERALSLFNPHYSRGADSIWWVSEPCSVHLHHSPAPTYLPFIYPCDYSYFFFFFFLRAPGNRISRCFQYGLSDLRMYGWMYGWMQGFASWWTGNMILQLCWESRICASFDCLGREGKGNRGGKRGGELH